MDKFVVNFREYNSFNNNESVMQNYMNYKDFNLNKINNIKQDNTNPNKVCDCYIDNDYEVDIKTQVPAELRWNNANSPAPPPLINGGLYSGPENNSPWMPQKVVPTTTYFMQTLLKSANPPPNASTQYPGGNRLGNNYTAMPGIYWFNSYKNPQNKNVHNFKVYKPE